MTRISESKPGWMGLGGAQPGRVGEEVPPLRAWPEPSGLELRAWKVTRIPHSQTRPSKESGTGKFQIHLRQHVVWLMQLSI